MRSKDEACCWRQQFSSWRSHTNRRDFSPKAEVTVIGHFMQNILLQQSRFPFPLGLQQEVPNPDSGRFKRDNFAAEVPPQPLWTQTSETPNLNLHLPSFFLSQSQSDMKTSKLINSVLEVSKPHKVQGLINCPANLDNFLLSYTPTQYEGLRVSVFEASDKK